MEILITAVTDGQKKQVKRFAEDAVDRAIAEGLLDKDTTQKLIENGDEFQARIIAGIKELLVSNQFADEEGGDIIHGFPYPQSVYRPKRTHQYSRICGMGFDTILERLGLARQQANETSWQFRKRAFPILWEHLGNEHNTLAMEFLLLLPQGEWSEPDMTRFMMLCMSNPLKKDLEKFARGFSCDPLEFRKARPAKTDWIANEIIASGA